MTEDVYEIAARVLMATRGGMSVDLSKHCDIYSEDGKAARHLLKRVASVTITQFDSFATSPMGTPLASKFDARIQAFRALVQANEATKDITKGKTLEECVTALKQLEDGERD